MTPLELWKSRYAFKVYGFGANEKEAVARGRLPIDEALQKKYIRTNTHGLATMIVVDVDRKDGSAVAELNGRLETETLPYPNWVLVNPSSGNLHIGYWLASPVPMSYDAALAPMKFYSDIQRKLTSLLRGDFAYTHYVTRSPFFEGHRVAWGRLETYTLKELASYTKGIESRRPNSLAHLTHAAGSDDGRNKLLFDTARSFAYEAFPLVHDLADLESRVLKTIEIENQLKFSENPLPASELRSIARSASKWTWKNFNPSSRSRAQRRLANHRWQQVRTGKTANEKYLADKADEREMLLELHESGLSYAEIGLKVGLTKEQIRNRIRYAKKKLNSPKNEVYNL